MPLTSRVDLPPAPVSNVSSLAPLSPGLFRIGNLYYQLQNKGNVILRHLAHTTRRNSRALPLPGDMTGVIFSVYWPSTTHRRTHGSGQPGVSRLSRNCRRNSPIHYPYIRNKLTVCSIHLPPAGSAAPVPLPTVKIDDLERVQE